MLNLFLSINIIVTSLRMEIKPVLFYKLFIHFSFFQFGVSLLIDDSFQK